MFFIYGYFIVIMAESTRCLYGMRRDKETGKCVVSRKLKRCVKGKRRNRKTRRCRKKTTKTAPKA